MPRTRSLAWSELKIGIVTIVAVGIAAVTIIMLTGGRGFFWQRYKLKTRFDNVAGLKGGSPVRVAGVEVGTVTDVALAGDKVDVSFEVNKEQRPRITDKSVAKLGSVSLLGESAVDITPSTTGTPVPDGGYVTSAPPAMQLSEIAEAASKNVATLTELVQDVRKGRGTVGKLMTDDTLYVELQKAATSANELVRGVRTGRGTIGKLLNDPASADALEASLRNVETITRQINAGQGTLGKLLQDPTLANSLGDATANLRELTNRLNRGEGTAGKLLNDPALFNRLNSVADRFDELMTKLNEGQGTAGQLLKDKQLYENMNGAVAGLRELLANINKDPRKYLSIKVSIF
jgi:phospholipid/cholesterol/gamma-HCH transport system substrate-binding protein